MAVFAETVMKIYCCEPDHEIIYSERDTYNAAP